MQCVINILIMEDEAEVKYSEMYDEINDFKLGEVLAGLAKKHIPETSKDGETTDSQQTVNVNIGNLLIGNKNKVITNVTNQNEEIPCSNNLFNYPITESTRELTQKDFWFVAKRISHQWKNLGRLMGLENWELEHIEYDCKNDIAEMAYQLFLKWQMAQPDNANAHELALLLQKIGQHDLASSIGDDPI